ncbi:MAG TPA: AmmeMemoRadiSam system protein A [Candidatus Acidoferrum sp.]|nr:AmmeMemoRadiSam system protein A [Candidatus Acidoferrum sp.]
MPSPSEAESRLLLELARQAITEAVLCEKRRLKSASGGIFLEKRGVFVTLHLRGRLRGCIGVVDACEPLRDAIARCAASAALQDPRFSPVQRREVADLQIELSLLSQPEPIRPEEIEIGKHGLLISNGPRRGLLLPQVAVEHKFDRERFLEETCTKAGLPPGAWRQPDTEILGFTCEVFSEAEQPYTTPRTDDTAGAA